MSNSKIFYSRTTVDFHRFIDLIAVFKPKRLSGNYNEYRKILIDEYQNNDEVVNILELIRNIEVDNGVLEVDSYNSISAVIYNNGSIKFVACY